MAARAITVQKYTLWVLVLLLCFFAIEVESLNGQNENNELKNQDLELWSGLSIARPIGKRLGVSLSIEGRINENIQQYKLAYASLEGEYELNKWIELGVAFRYTFLPVTDNNRQRLSLDLGIGDRMKPINWSYRLRYQLGRDDFELLSNGEHTIRNKLVIEYQRKKKHDWVPFIGAEVFVGPSQQVWNLQKYRLMTGISYDFNKRNKIRVRYIFQNEVWGNKQSDSHILRLDYRLRLRKKKKKKKQKKDEPTTGSI